MIDRPSVLDILDLSRSNVIEASAGTGKTFLVEHAVIELLIRHDVSIDEILLVTFTEKAAAELRARIRGLLQRFADGEAVSGWQVDAAVRQRLATALLTIDAAPIHTIHGFCLRMLKDYAFVSGRDLRAEQAERSVVFERAFASALRNDFATKEEYLPLLRAWRNHKSTDELRARLFTMMNLGGRVVPEVDEATLNEMRELAREPCLTVDFPFLEVAIKQAGVHRGSQAKLARSLEVLLSICRRLRETGDVYECLGAFEFDHRGLLDYLPTTLRKAKQLDGHLLQVAQVAERLRDVCVPLSAVVLAQFADEMNAQLRLTKQEHGEIDFQDMLDLLHEALHGDGGPALASQLQKRFRYVFVDEFQDTDELQWSIFWQAFGESESKLIVVGDPKQAIYGFRGADLHTYFGAKETLIARGANAATLIDNYRSSEALVAALNLLLQEAFDRFFTGPVRYDAPVVAKSSRAIRVAGHEPRPVTLLQPRTPERNLRAADIAKQLQLAIAKECQSLLAPERVEIEKDGVSRPLGASDIFILTRTIAESNQVAEALAAAGVPHCVYRQEGLFQSDEAQEILDVLNAIAYPSNNGLRARALRTRFVGLSLRELAAVSHAHGHILDHWVELASARPLHELFAALIADTDLVARLAASRGGERVLTNVQHIFEVLAEESANEGLDLPSLVAFLKRTMRDPNRRRGFNIKRVESDRHAVSIMTMHASKGLEAPVVFLYGGITGFSGGGLRVFHQQGERLLEVGPTRPETRSLVIEEELQESQRLLYVAMTRAQCKLYLPFIDPGEYPRVNGTHLPLNKRLHGVANGLGREDKMLVPLYSLRELGDAPSHLRLVPKEDRLDAPPPRCLSEEHMAALRARRGGERVFSYSSLKAGLGESDPATAPAPVVREADEIGGAAVGLFVHDLLEHADLADLRDADGILDLQDWQALPTIAAIGDMAAIRHGISRRETQFGFELAHLTLTQPLNVGTQLLPPLHELTVVARECDFLYQSESGLVRGVIDMVAEYKGATYVIDYKTDRLARYETAAVAAHTQQRYRMQIGLYSEALSRMASVSRPLGGAIYIYCRGLAQGEGVGFVDAETAAGWAKETLRRAQEAKW